MLYRHVVDSSGYPFLHSVGVMMVSPTLLLHQGQTSSAPVAFK